MAAPRSHSFFALFIPLNDKQRCAFPLPVRAIYSLAAPHDLFRKQPIRIEALSPREAFIELVKNTFNRRITDPDRLARQLAETSRLVGLLPTRKLSIPRDLNRLPAVRGAILDDLAGLTVGGVPPRRSNIRGGGMRCLKRFAQLTNSERLLLLH